MEEWYNRLYRLQNNIEFISRKELQREIPEQLMILKNLSPDSTVLELGGSFGRASCIINSILKNKQNHVVVEPNLSQSQVLQQNRDKNSFKFKIENSVISRVPLYSKNWLTYTTKVDGSVQVPIMTVVDLKQKYGMKFDALVIDNEGNFTQNLKDFPDILDGIKYLQIEHDFNTEDDYRYFIKTMYGNNFKLKDRFMKEDENGPGMNWSDGLKTDPIFVSVWTRDL